MPRSKEQSAALRRFGALVVRLRDEADLTQERTAEAAGLSVQYLRRIENGTGNPSLLVLRSLARALHVDLDEMVREVR
jgi:XRE family transcriptional regulator, aerobic/anaerobic benzoate catabolism transcriptional regulator